MGASVLFSIRDNVDWFIFVLKDNIDCDIRFAKRASFKFMLRIIAEINSLSILIYYYFDVVI